MTLIIDDKVKTLESSQLDFSVLERLCEKHQLWPRKVIVRKPRPEELKNPENNTAYYALGYLVFIMHDIPYNPKYISWLQAHEYRHILQMKRPWLKKYFCSEEVETIRKMLLAIISLGPITQELLGIDEENCRMYDPEETDANAFATATVKYTEPARKFIKRKKKNEDITPVTSDKP